MLKLVFKDFQGNEIPNLEPQSAMERKDGIRLAQYAEAQLKNARELINAGHPSNSLPARYEIVMDTRTDSPSRVDLLAERVGPFPETPACVTAPSADSATDDGRVMYGGRRFIPSGLSIDDLRTADGTLGAWNPVGQVVRISGDRDNNTESLDGRIGHITYTREAYPVRVDHPFLVAIDPDDNETTWTAGRDFSRDADGNSRFGVESRTWHDGGTPGNPGRGHQA